MEDQFISDINNPIVELKLYLHPDLRKRYTSALRLMTADGNLSNYMGQSEVPFGSRNEEIIIIPNGIFNLEYLKKKHSKFAHLFKLETSSSSDSDSSSSNSSTPACSPRHKKIEPECSSSSSSSSAYYVLDKGKCSHCSQELKSCKCSSSSSTDDCKKNSSSSECIESKNILIGVVVKFAEYPIIRKQCSIYPIESITFIVSQIQMPCDDRNNMPPFNPIYPPNPLPIYPRPLPIVPVVPNPSPIPTYPAYGLRWTTWLGIGFAIFVFLLLIILLIIYIVQRNAGTTQAPPMP